MGLIKAELYTLKYVLIVPIFVFMTIAVFAFEMNEFRVLNSMCDIHHYRVLLLLLLLSRSVVSDALRPHES